MHYRGLQIVEHSPNQSRPASKNDRRMALEAYYRLPQTGLPRSSSAYDKHLERSVVLHATTDSSAPHRNARRCEATAAAAVSAPPIHLGEERSRTSRRRSLIISRERANRGGGATDSPGARPLCNRWHSTHSARSAERTHLRPRRDVCGADVVFANAAKAERVEWLLEMIHIKIALTASDELEHAIVSIGGEPCE